MRPLIPNAPEAPGPRLRSRAAGGGDCARRVKRWTRQLLGLDEGVVVSVAELRCSDPGCPDLETVIGVPNPGGSWRTLRVAKTVCRVRRSDIARLLG